MKPSRELDALVAEHVMGWVKVEAGELVWWELENRRAHPDSNENPFPPYSTDIAAAWELAEKFALSLVFNERWLAGNLDQARYKQVDEYIQENFVSGETEAHAICLAALKAVGWKS